MNATATLRDALWRVGAADDGLLTLDRDDLHHWDDEVREAFLDEGILVPTTPASSVVCPRCETGHLEPVLWSEDKHGVAHPAVRCPEFGIAVLSSDDLECWRLVPAMLATLVGRELGPTAGPRELVPGRVWSLGFPVDNGQEVLLARGRSWTDSARIEAELSRHGDAVVVAFLAQEVRSDREVFLGDVVGWQRGSLTIDRERILVTTRKVGASESPDGSHVLVADQTGWTLAFGGSSFHLSPLRGLSDIHTLLAHPHETLLAWDLVGGQLIEAGIEAVDGEMLRHLRATLAAGGPGAESPKIHEFLRLATNPMGTTRRSPSPLTKAATAVRNRINTALQKIQEVNPNMASHLRASIKTGIDVRYVPREELDWRL